MVSEPQIGAVGQHAKAFGGAVTYTRGAAEAEQAAFAMRRSRRSNEFCWNHTTLRALKVDPAITYLQVLFPMGRNIEALAWAEKEFAGEILWHLEFQRRYVGFTNSSLPLVRFTTPERLNEIMAKLDANGSRSPIPTSSPGGQGLEAHQGRSGRAEARGRPPFPAQSRPLAEP